MKLASPVHFVAGFVEAIASDAQRMRPSVVASSACPMPPKFIVTTGGAGTVAFWQVAPWRTGAQNPKDAIEDAAVIYPPNAARLVGQHRFDGGPFVVAEFVAHDSRLRMELESRLGQGHQVAIADREPARISGFTSAFGGTADIACFVAGSPP